MDSSGMARCQVFRFTAVVCWVLFVSHCQIAQGRAGNSNAWVWPSDTSPPCQVPGGRSGSCVPLSSCHSVKALLNSNWMLQQMYLRMYSCNKDEAIPHVCCSDDQTLAPSFLESPQAINGVPSPVNTPFGQFGLPPAVSPAVPLYSSQPHPHTSHDTGTHRRFRTELERKTETHRNIRLLPSEDKCGKPELDERIIGGQRASLGDYPWLALLSFSIRNNVGQKKTKSQFACGGSLINARYVLTAAHCVENLPGSYQVDFVRLGEHDLQNEKDCEGATCAPPVQDIPVEKVISHSGYTVSQKDVINDISLIRLSHPAELNEYVQPVCLPRGDALFHDLVTSKTTKVVGWGRTHAYSTDMATVLQEVYLPVISRESCARHYEQNVNRFGFSRFCAGGVAGKDSCRGDSGGPLLDYVDVTVSMKQHYLYGIVSANVDERCSGTMPALYTNVSSFMPWILDHLEP